MHLAIPTPLEDPTNWEHVAAGPWIGTEVALHRLRRKLLDADPADP